MKLCSEVDDIVKENAMKTFDVDEIRMKIQKKKEKNKKRTFESTTSTDSTISSETPTEPMENKN